MRLIYIHGFNSAAASHKAEQLGAWLHQHALAVDYQVPSLSHYPAQAMAQLEALFDGQDPSQVALIGSSLGGYYATWLVEKYACRAALVNPAVRPYDLLQDYVGTNVNEVTGAEYEVGQVHFDQLLSIEVNALQQPEHYLLMVETADEVLDYRHAVARYSGAEHWIIPGGEHAFVAFEAKIPAILAFLKVL